MKQEENAKVIFRLQLLLPSSLSNYYVYIYMQKSRQLHNYSFFPVQNSKQPQKKKRVNHVKNV